MDFNLTKLRKDNVDNLPEKPAISVSNDRHMAMKDAIAPFAKKTDQKNLTSIYTDYKTRNTRICWVLCPEWAPEFPPFNLARLSGVCKSAGYESWIMDLNIKVHNVYQYDWFLNNKIPFRLWDPASSWHWLGETYYNDVHPLVEGLLEEAVEEIIQKNPEIVGFSMYYISEEPTNWMARELKKRAPHIKLAVGGSNTHQSWFSPIPEFDYIVQGEGEAAILEILDQIETGNIPSEQTWIKQPEKERINISEMPMPDYAGIDFNNYKVPNGVTSEFSRGCTAKCTFCDETHFWRYRQRRAEAVLEEAEWLWFNRGVDVIWFIDSLINGNVNELRAFALGIAAKELPTKWTGYARCDGRMDDEYFKDLKEGGCIMLNYGCESGSQNVLDSMHKGVTIKEMEDNFRLGKKYGIWAATNWVIGFPTEDLSDYANSMQFIWRNRNMNINNVGAGVGMAVGAESIVGQNPHTWNVSWQKYMGAWIRKDLSFGGTHLMHRVKFFYIYLDQIVQCAEHKWGYPVREKLKQEHYVINWHDDQASYDVEYENFNYDIIKPDINVFADHLVNQIWPLLRMLWLTRGGFDIEILFNADIDNREFGTQYGPCEMFDAVYKFSIDSEGNWDADFKYNFEQIENYLDGRSKDDEYYGPFFPQDYSAMQSNAAKRARKLAKPTWDAVTGRDGDDWTELLGEAKHLNSTVDFTFNYHYQNTGKWERDTHNIAVPNQVSKGSDHLAINKNIINTVTVETVEVKE